MLKLLVIILIFWTLGASGASCKDNFSDSTEGSRLRPFINKSYDLEQWLLTHYRHPMGQKMFAKNYFNRDKSFAYFAIQSLIDSVVFKQLGWEDPSIDFSFVSNEDIAKRVKKGESSNINFSIPISIIKLSENMDIAPPSAFTVACAEVLNGKIGLAYRGEAGFDRFAKELFEGNPNLAVKHLKAVLKAKNLRRLGWQSIFSKKVKKAQLHKKPNSHRKPQPGDIPTNG